MGEGAALADFLCEDIHQALKVSGSSPDPIWIEKRQKLSCVYALIVRVTSGTACGLLQQHIRLADSLNINTAWQ